MKHQEKRNEHYICKVSCVNFSARSLGLLAKTITETGRCARIKTRGTSMVPCLCDQQRVFVIPYTDTKPEIGDIVAYLDVKSSDLVIHRILEIVGCEFISKGDNCPHDDGRQLLQNIIGHVKPDPSVHIWRILHRQGRIMALMSRLHVIYQLNRMANRIVKAGSMIFYKKT